VTALSDVMSELEMTKDVEVSGEFDGGSGTGKTFNWGTNSLEWKDYQDIKEMTSKGRRTCEVKTEVERTRSNFDPSHQS
jgi:hypothetical protein